MRIFVAGATGVLGSRIVPLLVRAGHTVAGMTRSEAKTGLLRELGAEPVVCDVFDADALLATVQTFRPDMIVHELTDLPDHAGELAGHLEANARIRIDGTRNLIAAATAASCSRLLVESVAWPLDGFGGEAVAELERRTLEFGGVVLRYGQLYGAGTYYVDTMPDEPHVHVDTAAARTVELLDAPSGVVEVVDG